jgi:peptide chain release factor 2
LEAVSAQPDFWNDPEEAEKSMKQIQAKKSWTNQYEKVETSIQDLEVLFDFYSMDEVSEEEMKSEHKKALKQLEELELKKMLSSEEDQLSAMLEINPGAGGTESNDWASILMRMYIMWGEKNGYKVREVDLQ